MFSFTFVIIFLVLSEMASYTLAAYNQIHPSWTLNICEKIYGIKARKLPPLCENKCLLPSSGRLVKVTIFSEKSPVCAREETVYISAKAVCDLVSWHTCSMLWGRVVLVWLCVCVCVRKRRHEDIPRPSTPSCKWGGLCSPPCTPLLLLQSHVRTHNTLPSLFSHLLRPFFSTSLTTSDFCLLLSHTCLSSPLSPFCLRSRLLQRHWGRLWLQDGQHQGQCQLPPVGIHHTQGQCPV